MAAREHGAVEVDVAVAGGVPGEIFLSCYNIVPQSNLWAILLISTYDGEQITQCTVDLSIALGL